MSVSAGEQLAWEFVVAARWLAAGDPKGVMWSLLPGGAQWVRSPLDCQAHVLIAEGEHPAGVLQALCGPVVPTWVSQHERLPGGLLCDPCFTEPAVGRWLSDALGWGRVG